MKNILLFAVLAAGLVLTGACKATVSTNGNANANANKPATSPTATPAGAATPANPNPAETSAEGAQDFTLVNAAGLTISDVYISPHSEANWGPDIMGQDVLEDGASVDIKFHPATKAALWDLKVTDTKGTAVIWESLNLLEISKVTIHIQDGKPTATTEP
jgi:hypothetical protein